MSLSFMKTLLNSLECKVCFRQYEPGAALVHSWSSSSLTWTWSSGWWWWSSPSRSSSSTSSSSLWLAHIWRVSWAHENIHSNQNDFMLLRNDVFFTVSGYWTRNEYCKCQIGFILLLTSQFDCFNLSFLFSYSCYLTTLSHHLIL